MNTDKKRTLFTIGLTIFFLLGSAITVIWIDPFFQYHKPLRGISYSLDNTQYQTAGIAKTQDYTCALVGSSMVSNFSRENFSDKAINLSLPGSSESAKYTVAATVLSSHPDLERLYWGMDGFYICMEENVLEDKLYLYNNNYLDDVTYLWNKSGILKFLDFTKTDEELDLDNYMQWNRRFEYSERRVLEDPTMNLEGISWSEGTVEELTELAVNNTEQGILTLAQKYPNTEFVVFFTPTCVCDWKSTDYKGMVEIEKEVVGRLLEYDNITVYNFQSDRDIITNLFLYKDIKHYSEYVNDWMTDCMNNKTHILNESNYEASLEEICTIVEEYDWDYLKNREGTYRAADTLNEYLTLLENENYIIIAEAEVDEITQEKEEIINLLRDWGFGETWLSEEGKIYIGCWDGGKSQPMTGMMTADTGEESIHYNNLNISYIINEDAYLSGIYINGVQYRKNTAEMNFVIWDVERNRVTDAVGVDLSTGNIVWQKFMDVL